MTDADARQGIAAGYLWYDYFAIPQLHASECQTVKEGDFAKAVDSIPAYVQRCSHFIILSPCLAHDDLEDHFCSKSTWNHRGWCRAELASWALCQNGRNMSVITILHVAKVVEANPLQWLFSTPRTGQFTEEEDRQVVGEILHTILQARLKTEEDIFMYRFLKAIGAHILGADSRESDLGIWLQDFKFDDARDAGKYGFSPLHVAAAQGNVPVLRELMRQGLPCVDARTTHEVRQVFAPMQMTPLMVAAFFIPVPEINTAVCESLVELKADVSARSASGRQALHFAAVSSGGADTIDFLLSGDVGGQVDATDGAGETPLFAACEATSSCTLSSSVTQNIRRLCAHGADPSICNKAGYFPLYRIAAGGPEDVRALLHAKADGNQQVQRTLANTITSTVLPVLASLNQFDAGTALLAEHAIAATALHSHGLTNNFPTVRLLLDARADPSVRNARGLTPHGLITGVYNMTGPVAELLLHAELNRGGVDCTLQARALTCRV